MLRCLRESRSISTVISCQSLILPRRTLFVLQDDDKKRITQRKRDKLERKKEVRTTPKTTNTTSKRPQSRQNQLDEIRKKQFETLRSLVDQTSQTLYNKETVEVSQDYIDSTAKVIYDQVKPIFDPKITPKPIPSTKSSERNFQLPEAITERLGLAPSLLVNEQVQNWPVLLDQLKLEGGFTNLHPGTIRKFLRKIPGQDLVKLLPTIESMHEQANISIPVKTYYLFLRALASGKRIDEERLKLVEHYVDLIKQQTELTLDHYETLLVVYSKTDHFSKINEILQEMKHKGISISKHSFSAIMQGYIDRRQHQEAMEIFTGMKFLSKKTQPGEKEYTEIITSCVRNDQLEKGIDLYQEMINQKIPITQKLVANLAAGCSNNPQFKSQSWRYFFEIYKHDWTPDLSTYEKMLYISARDGDVDLTRALLYKMLETNTLTTTALTSLIMSYAKFIPANERPPLAIANTEKGLEFRQNIIDEIDFTKIVAGFPFLPNSNLTNRMLVLAESSAVWAYITLSYPQYINSGLATSYLDVALNQGKFEDFKHRFESATYLDSTGLPKTREVVIEEPESASIEVETTGAESAGDSVNTTTNITKSPLLSEVEKLFQDNRIKTPRDSITYMVALRAAGKFKQFNFLEEILKQHGDYRKTVHFQKLPRKTQQKLDFQFATVLVDNYTKMNMLEDALAVVISSETQFPWGKKQLGNLIRALYKIENFPVIDRLREIIGETQKSKGKIKRLDHRIYVKKRGY